MYTGGTRRRRGSSAPAQDGRLQFATESTRTIHEAEHQGWATFTPWRLRVILRDSNNVQHVFMNGSQRTLSAQTKMNHDGVQYILDCNADGRTDGNTGRTWTLMVDHNNMNYERSMSNCFLNIKFIDTSIKIQFICTLKSSKTCQEYVPAPTSHIIAVQSKGNSLSC